MEKKWFYVGINPCGCITASMTTCLEYATPKKVDDFKREMDLTGRTTELREFSKDEFMELKGGEKISCRDVAKFALNVLYNNEYFLINRGIWANYRADVNGGGHKSFI